MEFHEKEMDIDKLLERFQELNRNINISQHSSKLKKDIGIIFKEYQKIEEFYNNTDNKGKIYNPNEIIEDGNKLDHFLIAKMIYYNKKYFNFIPRKIQIISLIYFLEKERSSGLIQQINTGEGKSCIISFLAVYIALKEKKNIDILTSSKILAKRDALLFKDFYASFNLTVDNTSDHNDEVMENNSIFSLEPYECYNANIVYGDALSFEGDFLRTSFMKIKGRGIYRKFDCIIIDEIDNIALDNLKNTTELLDNFYGYKYLEYVYIFIYKKLEEIKDSKNWNAKDKKEEMIKELKKVCSEEFKDLGKLRKKNIFIPEHLGKYINDRLDDWCESAYLAKFVYEDNENYVKNIDKRYGIQIINPIDFYNTGVTQENTVWAGLHQFLQIDEKLMITEDNLSSCYISNLSFFNKYIKFNEDHEIIENNIYGLTGTIGSKYNKKTLKALYNLAPLIIPPFRKSLLKIEEPNILIMKEDDNEDKELNKKNRINYEEKWLNNIENKIKEMINKDRAVLVIFQYIRQAEKMEKKLKSITIKKNIISYLRSDKKQDKFLKDYIKPRTVILSTNLSGRGTDIRISPKLNENGGLHVILTYEPFNQRIERQAFGRAGRKGENGSAGKIVISAFTKEEAINETDKREKEESDFLINVYKEKIYTFERMFDKFSRFISDIKNINNNKSLLLDLKERWGLFLIENSMNNIEKKYKKNKTIDPNAFKEIEENYDEFEEKLRNYNYNYDFDYSITKLLIYFKNLFNNNSNNNNKDDYKFLNGLYLFREKDITKIDEGIKLCPILSIGGYMYKILTHINAIYTFKFYRKENNKISYNNIYEIEKNFKFLINNISLLVKQFEVYKDLLVSLGYNKEKNELFQQNEQKLQLMNCIKKLMIKNEEVFQNCKNENFKSLAINTMRLDDYIKREKLTINGLVYEYFLEYRVKLFELKEENNCLIY